MRRADHGYLDRLKSTPVLNDSLESVKKGSSPFALMLRLAKSLFGFPGGLINSMTAVAIAGYFWGVNVYILGKTGLIWIASLLYLFNFLFTYRKEFRQMKQLPPAA
ncbi:MAG: hypothetical protein IID15_03355 [Candidatus Marinimicrobia bacterium]|nr:hypothetical protein [Candidatus Neomarinimicrobiota bacterium]